MFNLIKNFRCISKNSENVFILFQSLVHLISCSDSSMTNCLSLLKVYFILYVMYFALIHICVIHKTAFYTSGRFRGRFLTLPSRTVPQKIFQNFILFVCVFFKFRNSFYQGTPQSETLRYFTYFYPLT